MSEYVRAKPSRILTTALFAEPRKPEHEAIPGSRADTRYPSNSDCQREAHRKLPVPLAHMRLYVREELVVFFLFSIRTCPYSEH
jgi:hypothetical protein